MFGFPQFGQKTVTGASDPLRVIHARAIDPSFTRSTLSEGTSRPPRASFERGDISENAPLCEGLFALHVVLDTQEARA